MRTGSYAATVGAMEQQKRLDIIANNISNANSPGYKKDGVLFSNFLDQASYTNRTQGSVRETANKTDIALFGNGYLKVQSDKGILYTRAGNLTVNSAKNLVTQDGWPVLGKNGPIRIENSANIRIEDNGQVFDENTPTDTLDIVEFPPDAGLKKVLGSYFEPTASGITATPATNCTVRQGSLESANFNPVEEMVQMVDTMRNFEAYQKTIQIFDRDLDAQLIAKLTG